MVQSIDRAMQIIHVLVSSGQRSQWSISDIAEKVELPLSTVHRLLSTMMKYGLVEQIQETKQYKAGHTWMEIGLRLLESLDYRSVARAVMERLAYEVKESIYLSIPSHTDAIIVERIDSPLTVRIIDNLGERIPLTIGAPNRTMLANMEPQEAERIVDRLLSSPDKIQDFLMQLPEIKRKGYAVSYGEKTEGTASVAAPIIGFNQKVVGALSIGVLSYKITDDRLEYLIEKVKEGASEISKKIGGIG